MLKILCTILFISVFATGCARRYKGPLPQTNLGSPEERQQEFEKFKFQEFSFFATGSKVVPMGKDQVYYRDEKMMDVIQSISPTAYSTFDTADTFSTAGLGFVSAGLGLIAGTLIVNDTPTKNIMFFSSVLSSLTGLTLSFISQGYAYSGVRTYNQDLKTKLLQDHIGKP